MDMLKIILERRSIRKYTGETVSREQLWKLVQAGMAAPSSRDTRHFNFVVVDNGQTIEKLTAGLPY
ncbi:MAG TPA: nitroreductase family protein, partial [Candidatus Omnitrophota bacterium]|nr:nitroreductase family protein [Candidatus Omnitrophota bacterium]